MIQIFDTFALGLLYVLLSACIVTALSVVATTIGYLIRLGLGYAQWPPIENDGTEMSRGYVVGVLVLLFMTAVYLIGLLVQNSPL